MDKKEEFLESMNRRHACKLFDENKKISQEDLEYILEVGRLSPSSFGMEPWKFLVVQSEEMKENLKPLCWNQAQITTCSELVIVLADIDNVKPNSQYVKDMFARRGLPDEAYNRYLGVYASHLEDTMRDNESILAWTSRQCYIAMGNMMTAAAHIGIDSCPIEGFEKENVEKLLGIDTDKWQLAVMFAIGYRVNPISKKLRRKTDDIIEFL
jgi:nitroreductase